MMKDAVENLSGNLKVLAPGYREDPSIEKAFPLRDGYRPDIPDDEMMGWTRRVRVPAVVTSERETRGISLVGIDPGEEQAISFLAQVTIRGEALADENDDRILLGAELAARLDTAVGRRVVIMTQGADGRNREAGFRVAGLYDAPGTALEKAYAFTGLHPLQKLLGTNDVTEVSIRLRDDRFSAAANGSLTKEMSGLEVLNWRQLDPQAAAFYEIADVGITIWYVILLLALAFGLINSLITAVLERVREFGMLRALGMRPRAVVVQVVIESVLIVRVCARRWNRGGHRAGRVFRRGNRSVQLCGRRRIGGHEEQAGASSGCARRVAVERAGRCTGGSCERIPGLARGAHQTARCIEEMNDEQ